MTFFGKKRTKVILNAKFEMSKILSRGIDLKYNFDQEFDPGSGRTLAARLTHASRTEFWIGSFRMEETKLSGGRVSNT